MVLHYSEVKLDRANQLFQAVSNFFEFPVLPLQSPKAAHRWVFSPAFGKAWEDIGVCGRNKNLDIFGQPENTLPDLEQEEGMKSLDLINQNHITVLGSGAIAPFRFPRPLFQSVQSIQGGCVPQAT